MGKKKPNHKTTAKNEKEKEGTKKKAEVKATWQRCFLQQKPV